MPLFHHVRELREQIMRIVRPGRSFRVVLHAEKWKRFVPDTFVRMIVQIKMRHFNFARVQRIWIDAKTVILRGDFHLIREQILYGMI